MDSEIIENIEEVQEEIKNTDISEQEKLEELYDKLDALRACL